MEVVNHKEEVPFEHYCKEWAGIDPVACGERSEVPFDRNAGTFRITMLGVEYTLHWPEFSIEGEGFAASNLPAQVLLMRYIMSSTPVPFRGAFLTFREMPWGEVYIKPFTGRCITRAAFTFGTRLDAFRAAMGKLGAAPVQHGDAAFETEFLPGMFLQVIVWEGDDEFPPNSQILFSDNFSEVFAAEDRVVCCDILISVVKSLM